MGHYIINNLIKENPKLGPLQMCISNRIDSFVYQLFKTYIYFLYRPNSYILSIYTLSIDILYKHMMKLVLKKNMKSFYNVETHQLVSFQLNQF